LPQSEAAEDPLATSTFTRFLTLSTTERIDGVAGHRGFVIAVERARHWGHRRLDRPDHLLHKESTSRPWRRSRSFGRQQARSASCVFFCQRIGPNAFPRQSTGVPLTMATVSRSPRLSDDEREGIRRAVMRACGEARADWRRIILFGSRVEPDRRGGDIDLLIEVAPDDAVDPYRLKQRPESITGPRPRRPPGCGPLRARARRRGAGTRP
jgi:predicted nucleotidyltransferase